MSPGDQVSVSTDAFDKELRNDFMALRPLAAPAGSPLTIYMCLPAASCEVVRFVPCHEAYLIGLCSRLGGGHMNTCSISRAAPLQV